MVLARLHCNVNKLTLYVLLLRKFLFSALVKIHTSPNILSSTAQKQRKLAHRPKGEGKFHPRTGREDPEGGAEVKIYSFFNLGASWVQVVDVTARPIYPRERGPVPIV